MSHEKNHPTPPKMGEQVWCYECGEHVNRVELEGARTSRREHLRTGVEFYLAFGGILIYPFVVYSILSQTALAAGILYSALVTGFVVYVCVFIGRDWNMAIGGERLSERWFE